MPDASRLSDLAVRFASSALGIGVTLVLLLALRVLLPPGERVRLRLPAIFLALYVILLVVRIPLDPATMTGRILAGLSLFLVLTALARCVFLVGVDLILEKRLGRPLPRIIQEILQALIYAGVLLITLRAAGMEPGSLLTTSALLTAVIGLSLQDT